MQVWSVISQKGGAGKTTVSIHLGIALSGMGYKVRVCDADPQQSSARWARSRDLKDPDFAIVIAPLLSKELLAAETEGFDIVLIDTSPRLDRECVIIARASDLIIVPVRPTILDVPAVSDTLRVLESARVSDRAVLVLNAVGPKSSEGAQAATHLEPMGLPLCPHRLQELLAFRRSLLVGRGVTEVGLKVDPKGQAAREILSLAKWLIAISEQRGNMRLETASNDQ